MRAYENEVLVRHLGQSALERAALEKKKKVKA